MTFSIDIARWAENAKGKEDLIVRKVCLDLFSRIILRSPVDTGRFRGNWQCAIANLPTGVIEVNDKTGTVTISKAQAVVAGVKAGDIVFLGNSLPYAQRIERGWSQQAPQGVIGVTVMEFQGVVNEAAE